DEIYSDPAENPFGTQIPILLQSCPHRPFTGFLAAPVDPERVNGVFLPIGVDFAAVENIVRRQVDERCSALVTSGGQVGSSGAIDRSGRLWFAFGAIHSRVSRKVDHQIGALPSHGFANRRTAGD